jgi:hypothetical protein
MENESSKIPVSPSDPLSSYGGEASAGSRPVSIKVTDGVDPDPLPRVQTTTPPAKTKRIPLRKDPVFLRSSIVAVSLAVAIAAVLGSFYAAWSGEARIGAEDDFVYQNTSASETARCLRPPSGGNPDVDPKIIVQYTFLAVDLDSFTLSARWEALACGSDFVDSTGATKFHSEILINLVSQPFPKGSVVISGVHDFALRGGPLYPFPLDKWNSIIATDAYYRDDNVSVSLATGVQVNPVSSSYYITLDLREPPDPLPPGALRTALLTGVIVARNTVSIVLVFFLAIAMWSLSISMLLTALDAVYIRPHRIEADVVGASISLLFALPQLRDAMPGVPTVGYAQLDIFGYSVCLVFAAFAAILLIWNFLLRTKIVDGLDIVPGEQLMEMRAYVESDHVRHAT